MAVAAIEPPTLNRKGPIVVNEHRAPVTRDGDRTRQARARSIALRDARKLKAGAR